MMVMLVYDELTLVQHRMDSYSVALECYELKCCHRLVLGAMCPINFDYLTVLIFSLCAFCFRLSVVVELESVRLFDVHVPYDLMLMYFHCSYRFQRKNHMDFQQLYHLNDLVNSTKLYDSHPRCILNQLRRQHQYRRYLRIL